MQITGTVERKEEFSFSGKDGRTIVGDHVHLTDGTILDVYKVSLRAAIDKGAQYRFNLEGEKKIVEVSPEIGQATSSQSYVPEVSTRESIETQVAVKALVDLKVAGQLDGELKAAWPSAVRWLCMRLIPEGTGSVEVVDTQTKPVTKMQLDAMTEMLKKATKLGHPFKWRDIIKAKFPLEHEAFIQTGHTDTPDMVNLLGYDKVESLIKEQDKLIQEMK